MNRVEHLEEKLAVVQSDNQDLEMALTVAHDSVENF